MAMPRRSINEAPPAPEQLRAMENLLAPSEELAGLVNCILDWDFQNGPFSGAHLLFEYSRWADSPVTFCLSLTRPVAQRGQIWKGVCVIRSFLWQYPQNGERSFRATTVFRRGTEDLAELKSPHQKDQCIVFASFAGFFDVLSAVRASIPEGAFTKISKP